jgi:hypothetical protein
MVAVVEAHWQDIIAGTPLPESPVRQAFREAVEAVAQKAREALPEANGRIDAAVKLVLQGDVELLLSYPRLLLLYQVHCLKLLLVPMSTSP